MKSGIITSDSFVEIADLLYNVLRRKMTVYLDIVLIENLCMNYIILFATGFIMKLKMKHLRLILSSLLGSIYAILAYMQVLEIYSTMIK